MLIAATAVVATSLAPPRYTHHVGYLPQGADLLNGSMSIAHAQRMCNSLAECTGFTFAGSWDNVKKSGIEFYRAHVWLKGMNEYVESPGHITLVKVVPECPNVKFSHYKRASHGPLCCDGKGCPAPDAYATVQATCKLPSESPFGIPRCSNLRGDPLPNVATRGKATASSGYKYAENSGPEAAIDGIVNSRFFHSECEKGPQWWHLKFPEPMVRHAPHPRLVRHSLR
jgi:hypothetical protein